MFLKLCTKFCPSWLFKKSKADPDVIVYLTTNQLFHRLWTKAVGTADYNKEEWLELEKRLQVIDQMIERICDPSLREQDEKI